MASVIITRHELIETAIEEALKYISMDSMIRGRVVAVKPNETSAKEEDMNGVTQADTLRGVLRYLKKFNPRELIVSGGAGAAETDYILQITGMMDVIKSEGVAYFDHNKSPFVSVELEYSPHQDVSGPQKTIMVNPRILEYETIVSLSQLKVHKFATVTLSLKNTAMSFPAADYYGHPRSRGYHRQEFFEDLHSFIAAMGKRFPINLAIIAGHPAMVGTGPLGGFAAETGLIIASTDPLAADVVGAKLLGFDIQAVRHLWEARALGVGSGNIAEYEFPALKLDEAVRIYTKAVYGREFIIK